MEGPEPAELKLNCINVSVLSSLGFKHHELHNKDKQAYFVAKYKGQSVK